MSDIRKYETIVIFDPTLSDQQVKDGADNVERILRERGAKDIVSDDWGRRELAYELKQRRYGIYRVFYFETDNTAIPNEVASALRINEGVMKFQTHRIQEAVRKFKGRPRSDEDSSESKAA